MPANAPPGNHTGYKTATGVGTAVDLGAGSAYTNFSLVPTAFSPDSIMQLEVSPDNSTWTPVGRTLGGRAVSVLGSHILARYVRFNVITLGTGTPGPGIGGVITVG
jgi:hypothetical protein